MTDPLVKRLRDAARVANRAGRGSNLYLEAADKIEALAASSTTVQGVEPVAWQYQKGGKTFLNTHNLPWKSETGWIITPLYAHPATPAPVEGGA
ncbi:hypothetical protein MASR1M32_10150 [Rhodobacter sp.]